MDGDWKWTEEITRIMYLYHDDGMQYVNQSYYVYRYAARVE